MSEFISLAIKIGFAVTMTALVMIFGNMVFSIIDMLTFIPNYLMTIIKVGLTFCFASFVWNKFFK